MTSKDMIHIRQIFNMNVENLASFYLTNWKQVMSTASGIRLPDFGSPNHARIVYQNIVGIC